MRILWLLNHTTAREFEVPLLRQLGFEVYAPKLFPSDIRSASSDFALDAHLTITPQDLEALNNFDFYSDSWPVRITGIVNSNFNYAISSAYPYLFDSTIKYFKNTILLRAYGTILKGVGYGKYFSDVLNPGYLKRLSSTQDRIFFSGAFSHLYELEDEPFRSKSVFMPVGLPANVLAQRHTYQRSSSELIVVLPDIRLDAPSEAAYNQIKRSFGGIPKAILGAQTIPVNDPDVKGFLAGRAFDHYMKSAAVMFYHSVNAYHLHYHPLEAMCYGMPVLYMSEGLIPHQFDPKSPAVCNSLSEARKKIKRIIGGDRGLIDEIKAAQQSVVDRLTPEACLPFWRSAFEELPKPVNLPHFDTRMKTKPLRIALFVDPDTLYNFENLIRSALEPLLQQTAIEIVVGVRKGFEATFKEAMRGLLGHMTFRELYWRSAEIGEVSNILRFAGIRERLFGSSYAIPRDSVGDYDDCALFLFCDASLQLQLAPVKPYVMLFLGAEQLSATDARNANAASLAGARAILVRDATVKNEVAVRLLAAPPAISLLPQANVPKLQLPAVQPGARRSGLWLCGPKADFDAKPYAMLVHDLAVQHETSQIQVIGIAREHLSTALRRWRPMEESKGTESSPFWTPASDLSRRELISALTEAAFVFVSDRSSKYVELLQYALGRVYIAGNSRLWDVARPGWERVRRDNAFETISDGERADPMPSDPWPKRAASASTADEYRSLLSVVEDIFL